MTVVQRKIVEAVSAFGMGLIKPVTDLISEVVTDRDEAARLAHEIATLASKQAQEVRLGQIEVNKVEAAHKSLFVAGWRPAAGWVCVLSMAFNYIVAPVLAAVGFEVVTLDLAVMLPVLIGMLGMGTLRGYEKVQGVAREQ